MLRCRNNWLLRNNRENVIVKGERDAYREGLENGNGGGGGALWALPANETTRTRNDPFPEARERRQQVLHAGSFLVHRSEYEPVIFKLKWKI